MAANLEDFNAAIRRIEIEAPHAATYIAGIDRTLWAQPFMTAKRYGIHTDNFVESMNAWLLPERGLSCLEMLIGIWNKVMDRRAERLLDINRVLENPAQNYTPFAIGLVHENLLHGNNFTDVRLSGRHGGVVQERL